MTPLSKRNSRATSKINGLPLLKKTWMDRIPFHWLSIEKTRISAAIPPAGELLVLILSNHKPRRDSVKLYRKTGKRSALILKSFPCDLLDNIHHPLFIAGEEVPWSTVRRSLRATNRILRQAAKRYRQGGWPR